MVASNRPLKAGEKHRYGRLAYKLGLKKHVLQPVALKGASLSWTEKIKGGADKMEPNKRITSGEKLILE